MKEPIFGIYEKALPVSDMQTMLTRAKAIGYDSLELSIDSTDKRLARLMWDTTQIDDWTALVHSCGMRMVTMCLSGHKRFPLGHPDPEVVKTGMDIMRRAIDFALRAGIRVIQLSGFDVLDEALRTKDTQKRYEENIAKSVKMAERACVTLAIEPVEGNLLDVRRTMRLVNAIDSPFLGVYPDPANILSLGIDPIPDLEFGKGRIAAVHMRESLPGIFDATVPLGTGNLDFEAVIRQLDTLGFAGPMIVEMWNENRPEGYELIAQARDYLAQTIQKVGNQHV